MFSSAADIVKICLQDLRRERRTIYENDIHIKAALEWLCLAQDKTTDGGVAGWYSPLVGWSPSYIETTGYIIDTFLDCTQILKDSSLKQRAIKMADFIVDMQLPSGGYRTHIPGQEKPSVPTVFNTGQDLLGLTSIYKVTKNKKYLESFIKAANFLCQIQEKDGSWFKYTFGNKTHTYHTRVAWGLLKVYQITKGQRYKNSAIKNLEWASAYRQANGWFKNAELPPPCPKVPFTHTISYTMEGFLFSGILLGSKKWVLVAKNAADKILQYFEKNNFIPGTFDNDWRSEDRYSCLTGDAQISVVWLTLYKLTKDKKYLSAARRINRQLKSIQDISTNNKDIRGAIKGSLPIYGDILEMSGYCRMSYLNWATKFFIDALLLEEKLNN